MNESHFCRTWKRQGMTAPGKQNSSPPEVMTHVKEAQFRVIVEYDIEPSGIDPDVKLNPELVTLSLKRFLQNKEVVYLKLAYKDSKHSQEHAWFLATLKRYAAVEPASSPIPSPAETVSVRDGLVKRFPRHTFAVSEVAWYHGNSVFAAESYVEYVICVQPGFDKTDCQNFGGNSLEECIEKFNNAAEPDEVK